MDRQHANARSYIDDEIRIRVTEVVELLLAMVWRTGIGKIVAFTVRAAPVDEMDALYETVEFIVLGKRQADLLQPNKIVQIKSRN